MTLKLLRLDGEKQSHLKLTFDGSLVMISILSYKLLLYTDVHTRVA